METTPTRPGPSAPRQALVLVNRNSRRGSTDVGHAMALLRASGLVLVEAECGEAEEVSPCILAHRGQVDRVVVAGGDGSLNAAARGIVESGLPLGVLPMGTANDFARSLGVPQDLPEAVQIIAGGHTRAIDIGLVNDRYFFNVSSIGLAADLAASLTQERKRRFGRLSYAFTAARLLTRATPFHATLVVGEDTILVKTLQVAIGNGRFYGGGNLVAQGAELDDGLLDLYSLEFPRIWRMAFLLGSFKQGRHGANPDVRTAHGTRFEVITRKPRPVNADGELVTFTPAVFTQKREAVRVFVPGASSASPAR